MLSTFCAYARAAEERLGDSSIVGQQRNAIRKSIADSHTRCAGANLSCTCVCHHAIELKQGGPVSSGLRLELEGEELFIPASAARTNGMSTSHETDLSSVLGSVRKPGASRSAESRRPPRLRGPGLGYYVLDGSTKRFKWMHGSLSSIRKAHPRGWILRSDPERLLKGFSWDEDRGWIWPHEREKPLSGLRRALSLSQREIDEMSLASSQGETGLDWLSVETPETGES